MKSTKVQTPWLKLAEISGIFELKTPLHAYVLGKNTLISKMICIKPMSKGRGFINECKCSKRLIIWKHVTIQGCREHFTFGQAGFSGEGESVEKRVNRVR